MEISFLHARSISFYRHQLLSFLIPFAIGILLSAAYLSSTAFNERGYDWDGHLEYIEYIVEHHAIPPAGMSWESHQPPLYYALSAVLWGAEETLGVPREIRIRHLQVQSWVLYVVALFVGLSVIREMFRREDQRMMRFLFGSLFAVFPGIVFFSARVNNDILLLLFSSCFFLFLLRWWRRGSVAEWVLLSIAIGFGLLSKHSALALIPIAFGCLFLRFGLPWKKRAQMAAIMALILSFMVGWLYVQRFGIEGERFIIGSGVHVNPGLGVSNDVSNFLTFNPVAVIQKAYNSTWSDHLRRQYYWEFLFRSSFIGEWDFGPRAVSLVRFLEILGMGALMMIIAGFLRSMRRDWRESAPYLFSVFFIFASAVGMRIFHSYSSVQDFRYIPVILFPFYYFFSSGCEVLPKRVRVIVISLMAAFFVGCLLLFALLSFDIVHQA